MEKCGIFFELYVAFTYISVIINIIQYIDGRNSDLQQRIKALLKLLFVFTLSFSTIFISGLSISSINTIVIAEAAVKAPSLKDKSITLYTGYDTYKVEIKNLSKSATVSYKSDRSKVATVTKNGTIKPIAKGSANITVTVKQNGKTYNLKLEVKVKKPSVTFSKSTNYLNVSDTFQYTAKVNGMDDEVKWSTSDSSIASINSKGKVTALAQGKVYVYAEAGDKTARCTLEIGQNRIGTFSTNVTLYDETTIWITAKDLNVSTKDEILSYELDKKNIIKCKWGETWTGNQTSLKIEALKRGTDTITISSDKTHDKLIINVTVEKNRKTKKEYSSKEIYQKCGPATVEIEVSKDDGEAQGSGFFIDNGVVVTNYHVIDGAKRIVIKTNNGREYECKTILGYNALLDLAVLKINCKNESLVISETKSVVGEDIYALGSPLGLSGTMTKGMISTASRIIENVDFIQIDAPISNGNSGGPLVNVYGEVIGVNTMGATYGQNLNFAVNINELKKVTTNNPITVAEYYEEYSKQMFDDFLYEDDEISNSMSTCQTIDPKVYGIGEAEKDEKVDYYKINITQSTTLHGHLLTYNNSDYMNVQIALYDQNGTLIGTCFPINEDCIQKLECSVEAGTYYLGISLVDYYTGEDIIYAFGYRCE
jgi:hypothetical protein